MKLTVETGLRRYISTNYERVEMGHFKISTARPLYTYGAVPCMNVVVHNETSGIGGLAHIAAVNAPFFDPDQKLGKRFEKADKVINAMISQTGAPPRGSETVRSGDVAVVDGVTGGTEDILLGAEQPSKINSLMIGVLRLFNNTQPTAGADIAIWLGAGAVYYSPQEDFPAYIRRVLGPLSEHLRIIDERNAPDTGDVVYDPFNARIYRMQGDDLEFIRRSQKSRGLPT